MEIIVSGYAYPTIAEETLKLWLKDMTFLNLFSYGVTGEGEITDLADEQLIEMSRNAGVQPLMVLTPMDSQGMFSDVLAAQLLENRQAQTALIENLLSLIRRKGLAGIDFDFEFIPEKNKDQYVELVRQTRERLHEEGYYVTVALAPKVSAQQQGSIYPGHDYPGMGEAADYVLLMTYEWGYMYGPPMAVSPINQVRRVLDYGVSAIPREKILLGMPYYGYDWKLPFIKGESKAEKLSPHTAWRRAENQGVEVVYDQLSQAPYYTYYDGEGLSHVVWFEDERSLRAKLALIEEYGLAGAAYWNIMDYGAENSAALHSLYEVKKI